MPSHWQADNALGERAGVDGHHLPLLPVRDGEHSLMLGQFADAEVQLQKLLGIEAPRLNSGQRLDAPPGGWM